jgi:hypothetical protein
VGINKVIKLCARMFIHKLMIMSCIKGDEHCSGSTSPVLVLHDNQLFDSSPNDSSSGSGVDSCMDCEIGDADKKVAGKKRFSVHVPALLAHASSQCPTTGMVILADHVHHGQNCQTVIPVSSNESRVTFADSLVHLSPPQSEIFLRGNVIPLVNTWCIHIT